MAVLGSTNSRPHALTMQGDFVYKHSSTLFSSSSSPFVTSTMNAVAVPSSRPVQLQPNQQPLSPWEFTRRKRWADLLMSELSEAIVLILSPRHKVLFCNPTVREILGWQNGELIDRDLTDLVNGLCLTRSYLSCLSDSYRYVRSS